MTIKIETDDRGAIRYYKDEKLHREDGPAISWVNGDQWWYYDGELHRYGAPAIIFNDGEQWWYQHGKLHREDGPAVIWPDGHTAWCLHYAEYTFDTWCELTNIAPEQKTLLMLKYQT